MLLSAWVKKCYKPSVKCPTGHCPTEIRTADLNSGNRSLCEECWNAHKSNQTSRPELLRLAHPCSRARNCNLLLVLFLDTSPSAAKPHCPAVCFMPLGRGSFGMALLHRQHRSIPKTACRSKTTSACHQSRSESRLVG